MPFATPSTIDTSGGLLDAVWTLHEQNPALRFDLQLDAIPMAEGLDRFSEETGIPAGAALLGGAGEYELLFTTHRDLSKDTQRELKQSGMSRIGRACRGPEPGVVLERVDGSFAMMRTPPPQAREVETVEQHADDVIAMAATLFAVAPPEA